MVSVKRVLSSTLAVVLLVGLMAAPGRAAGSKPKMDKSFEKHMDKVLAQAWDRNHDIGDVNKAMEDMGFILVNQAPVDSVSVNWSQTQYDVTLVASLWRGRDGLYAAQASWEWVDGIWESKPNTKDVVGVDWESADFSYSSWGSSSNSGLQDVSHRLDSPLALAVFWADDYRIDDSNPTGYTARSGWVQIRLRQNANTDGKWTTSQTKYTHTYDGLIKTTTTSTLSFTSLGAGVFAYDVQREYGELKWDVANSAETQIVSVN